MPPTQSVPPTVSSLPMPPVPNHSPFIAKKLFMILGVLFLLFLAFCIFSVVYVNNNPVLNAENYTLHHYSPLGINLLLPKDCVMESQLSYGFQCKSSEYTFDNGQKEGYLITVAGKEVTDITMTGKSFENTSDDIVLTGKTAWEYDLKEIVGACKMYPCVEKTVSGYPAITFSIFITDEKMSAFNAEMTSIFIDNNAYVLSARAKTQIESKKILSKMEERFSLTQDTNSTAYKNQEAGIYTISDLSTEQGVFDAITKGTPLEGHVLVKEDQYTFTDGKGGDDTVGYKRNRADYTVYNGNNVSEKDFFNTIIVVGKAEHFIEVDVNSEFIQFADQIVSIPDFNVVPNAKRY